MSNNNFKQTHTQFSRIRLAPGWKCTATASISISTAHSFASISTFSLLCTTAICKTEQADIILWIKGNLHLITYGKMGNLFTIPNVLSITILEGICDGL